jgi:hypothetical protein
MSRVGAASPAPSEPLCKPRLRIMPSNLGLCPAFDPDRSTSSMSTDKKASMLRYLAIVLLFAAVACSGKKPQLCDPATPGQDAGAPDAENCG